MPVKQGLFGLADVLSLPSHAAPQSACRGGGPCWGGV